MTDPRHLEIVKKAVTAIPAADARRLLEKVREDLPDLSQESLVGLATHLVLDHQIQAHGPLESRRYYPAKLEVRAEDLTPGTGFEVKVNDHGEFHVWVFYRWGARSSGYDGEGYGATFSQAAVMAIQDAEGELEWDAEESP